MPFVKADQAKEQREFEELLKDPAAKAAYEEFDREYRFRHKLAAVRKSSTLSSASDGKNDDIRLYCCAKLRSANS